MYECHYTVKKMLKLIHIKQGAFKTVKLNMHN